MASFSTRNLLTSTLLAFANKAARRNLNTFHQWNNSSSFTRRYVQNNIETRGTVIIQNKQQVCFLRHYSSRGIAPKWSGLRGVGPNKLPALSKYLVCKHYI